MLLDVRLDDYAYYDPKTKRYRAGKYSSIETGRFVSKTKARRIRGAGRETVARVSVAQRFRRSYPELSAIESFDRARQWQKDYREYLRMVERGEIPARADLTPQEQARAYVEEAYSLRPS